MTQLVFLVTAGDHFELQGQINRALAEMKSLGYVAHPPSICIWSGGFSAWILGDKQEG